MGAAPPPPPNDQTPTQPALLAAWPRCVQMAMAVLLGLATIGLAVRSLDYFWSTLRPTERSLLEGVAYQIDLNSAERPELLQLPGIGESLAQRILDYRREHGGFRRVEDLRRVRGIGPITLDKLRPWVYVSEREDTETESDDRAQRVRIALLLVREAPTHAVATTGKKLTPDDAPLDINQATLEDLKCLPGIGPKLAEAIVAARDKKPFASVDELRRVKGIGPKTLEKVRPFVFVRSERLQLAATERE
jgi:competence protein ComEA